MPTTKKYKSKRAAAETLKRFFASSPDSDQVLVDEIFRITGRQQMLLKANMAWLSNKLTTLRYHNMINAEYSYSGRRRLESISLSLEGKRVLGRVQGKFDPNQYSNNDSFKSPETDMKASIKDVLATINELNKMYPELDISLTVKSKEAN